MVSSLFRRAGSVVASRFMRSTLVVALGVGSLCAQAADYGPVVPCCNYKVIVLLLNM